MVWELRSHMLCNVVKKKKRALIKLRWLRAFRVVSLGGTGVVDTVGLMSMALCCGAQWVWGTVCEGLEHPWIWAFWAGDFLEPAPHGMRGDSLEQSWETGI